MPRSFLIKKHFGGGASKSKRPRTDGNVNWSDAVNTDTTRTCHYEVPGTLTPPRTPLTTMVTTPPPPVVSTFMDTKVHPINLQLSPSDVSLTKSLIQPFWAFNFPSLYPAFPQAPSDPHLYLPMDPVTLPQRTATATLPTDQHSSFDAQIPKELQTEVQTILQPSDCNNNSNPDGIDGYKKRTGETTRYQCPDCSKSYSTLSGMNKHQQFHCIRQAKKSLGCRYCDKVYASMGALKMHMRTHTLPCKCNLCGKAFSRPWLLQGHIRTHTGEKPFSCQHCNRAFADRSNLRAHLQTHSDVKKYSCKKCTKTFSRMSLLLKHEDGTCCTAAQQPWTQH